MDNKAITPDTMIGLPEEEAFKAINRYNLACKDVKEAEERKELAKKELVKLLGGAQIGICADMMVKYVPQVKETIDAKQLKLDYPDIAEQYTKRTEFYKIGITHIK